MRLFSKHLDHRLSEYIDRRLSPADAARVESYLAACDHCRERLDGLRDAVAALQSLPEVDVPRSFAINEAMVRPVAEYRPPRWQPFAAPAAGMAVIFVLLLGGDLATSIGSEDDEDVVQEAASEELIETDALASEQAAPAEESAPQAQPHADEDTVAGDQADGEFEEESEAEEPVTPLTEETGDRDTAGDDQAEAAPPDPETVEQLENIDEDDDSFRLFVRLVEAALAVGALALGVVAFRRWRASVG